MAAKAWYDAGSMVICNLIYRYMTLDERKAKALELHASGYNCAQSVLKTFDDCTGVDNDVSTRFAMGMGAGLGQGDVCGVVLGMAAVIGLSTTPDTKLKGVAYGNVRKATELFKNRNQGYHLCRDLKGKAKRPCDDLILDGVEILHNFLEGDK